MQEYLFGEQVEENQGEDACLLYAVQDSEFLRWLFLGEDFTCHAVTEQLDEGDNLGWVS